MFVPCVKGPFWTLPFTLYVPVGVSGGVGGVGGVFGSSPVGSPPTQDSSAIDKTTANNQFDRVRHLFIIFYF